METPLQVALGNLKRAVSDAKRDLDNRELGVFYDVLFLVGRKALEERAVAEAESILAGT